ncbi:MAG: VOC family protein [Nocardioides sp.]|jgi:catechol 2,3-dioxygenase-like lactoylglutathione lyase family enzyme
MPEFDLSATVLGCADPAGLASFYRDLLGWEIQQKEPDWVTLRPSHGGAGLSFQTEEGHVPPTWPPASGDQQMQLHLDIRVNDLDSAVSYAQSLGASLAQYQPQQDVRVLLDPAGHPFCLFQN